MQYTIYTTLPALYHILWEAMRADIGAEEIILASELHTWSLQIYPLMNLRERLVFIFSLL